MTSSPWVAQIDTEQIHHRLHRLARHFQLLLIRSIINLC